MSKVIDNIPLNSIHDLIIVNLGFVLDPAFNGFPVQYVYRPFVTRAAIVVNPPAPSIYDSPIIPVCKFNPWNLSLYRIPPVVLLEVRYAYHLAMFNTLTLQGV
jgi:hypothetical protein